MAVVESLGALRERQFRLLYAGQTFSNLGSALVPIALAFAVLDLTGSATDLGVLSPEVGDAAGGWQAAERGVGR
jgi:hypothetical protein